MATAPPEKTELTALKGDIDAQKQRVELPEPVKEVVDDGHPMMTSFEAMMNLMKATVGVGMLALPLAFKNAGLWVGFFGLLLMGSISLHCMHLLVGTSRYLCAKLGRKKLDYDELAVAAIEIGPESLRRFSKYGGYTVNFFLIIAQGGYCAVIVLFIAQSVQQVVECQTGVDLHIQLWLFFTFLILLVYVFLRSLKYLAILAMVANVGVLVAAIIIFQHIVRDLPDASEFPAFNSWRTLPLFFGTAVFAVEGIALVLPIENNLKYPKEFVGLTGVLNTSIVIIIALYTAMAFYGYLKYGDDVQASITLNLPTDHWLYLSVKLMFALSVYVSFGLQFYVFLEIIWKPLECRLGNEALRKYGEYVMRFVIICLTYLLAVVVPHLDLMVSLTGSIALAALAAILPALFHLLAQWHGDLGKYQWKLVKDICIIAFGFTGFVVGTAVSLMEIIKAF